MFVTNDNDPKLSQKAREEYDKLQAQLAELVASDRVREPKLTGDEKKEIAELQARITHLAPVSQKLLALLEEKDGRLKFLERGNAVGLVITNLADLDKLVGELVSLKPAIQLLSGAYNATSLESSQANEKIKTIKEKARAREIAQERSK